MRRAVLFFVCAAALGSACFGQSRVEVRDIVEHPFSADFAPGSRLRLHVRSGEVHVLGVDENRISVELSGRKAREAGDLKVRFDRKAGAGELKIWGGPRNDLTITIRIPKTTDLYARIPFGEVHVENVAGNKDVSLHAGDLTIAVGDSADYGRVDASVITGEVDADAFGETRGGLFRSFHRDGSGRFRLYAHVGAGQLTLQ